VAAMNPEINRQKRSRSDRIGLDNVEVQAIFVAAAVLLNAGCAVSVDSSINRLQKRQSV